MSPPSARVLSLSLYIFCRFSAFPLSFSPLSSPHSSSPRHHFLIARILHLSFRHFWVSLLTRNPLLVLSSFAGSLNQTSSHPSPPSLRSPSLHTRARSLQCLSQSKGIQRRKEKRTPGAESERKRGEKLEGERGEGGTGVWIHLHLTSLCHGLPLHSDHQGKPIQRNMRCGREGELSFTLCVCTAGA